VRRLLWFRPYPDPSLQLLLRVTDILAVLGLIACILLAMLWIRKERPDPVTLCIGLYICLALVLCSPSYMIDALGFARPVSPLLLWVTIQAVYRKTWAALAPPLLISLSVSLVFALPFVAVVKGLLSGRAGPAS
jgi:hypothetical protein